MCYVPVFDIKTFSGDIDTPLTLIGTIIPQQRSVLSYNSILGVCKLYKLENCVRKRSIMRVLSSKFYAKRYYVTFFYNYYRLRTQLITAWCECDFTLTLFAYSTQNMWPMALERSSHVFPLFTKYVIYTKWPATLLQFSSRSYFMPITYHHNIFYSS